MTWVCVPHNLYAEKDEDEEDDELQLQGDFIEHHALRWMPRVAMSWGYSKGACHVLPR